MVILQDFRWGVTLNQLGYASAAFLTSTSYAYPPPITIAAGASASLISTDNIQLNLSTDLIFPAVYKVDNVKFVLVYPLSKEN